jgi:hypothetical protein
MLDEPERIELNIIDRALASMPRYPRHALAAARELQYSCNRCLCRHTPILTRLHSQNGGAMVLIHTTVENHLRYCQRPIHPTAADAASAALAALACSLLVNI